MGAAPERSAERDAAIDAILPLVPLEGWTMTALRSALRDGGGAPEDAAMLFPGGALDLIETFCDLADRRMEAEAAGLGLAELRVSRRVAAVIGLRLRQSASHKEAIRRAVARLALPANAALAARCTARTVDAIWHAAGDRSADFSWYSKRAILASVYTPTLLFWLQDGTEDDAATLAFLDHCLAATGQVGRVRRRLAGWVRRSSPSAA